MSRFQTTTSADGTTIAYEIHGDGPPLVSITGAIRHRSFLPVRRGATIMGQQFRVFSYDRRGRGDSTDTETWSLAREVEAVEAVIDAAGGQAVIYGHSSGKDSPSTPHTASATRSEASCSTSVLGPRPSRRGRLPGASRQRRRTPQAGQERRRHQALPARDRDARAVRPPAPAHARLAPHRVAGADTALRPGADRRTATPGRRGGDPRAGARDGR